MKIQLNNKTFKLIWKYLFVKPFHKKDPLSTTFCYIYDGDTRKEVAWGFACQSQKDDFDREKARKVSLTTALQILGTNKIERKAVWDQYLNRKTSLVKT